MCVCVFVHQGDSKSPLIPHHSTCLFDSLNSLSISMSPRVGESLSRTAFVQFVFACICVISIPPRVGVSKHNSLSLMDLKCHLFHLKRLTILMWACRSAQCTTQLVIPIPGGVQLTCLSFEMSSVSKRFQKC